MTALMGIEIVAQEKKQLSLPGGVGEDFSEEVN